MLKLNILQQFLSLFKTRPDPEFVAEQLRKPSGHFAQEIGEKMNRANGPLYDLTFDAMDLRLGDSVLEIGFGNGRLFEKLFSNASGVQVNGIDYSKEMVNEARDYNRSSIASDKLNLKWGNSDFIPYPAESFDKVFCNMVIYFWDQPEPHLKEVRRVLKPGGAFYTGIRSLESMQFFPFVEHGFNLYKVSEWEEILGQNGFSLVDTHTRLDPEMDFEGNNLRLESCCIVAKKN